MVYLYVNKKATALFKQLRNSLKLGCPLKNEEHAFFKNLGGKIMLGDVRRSDVLPDLAHAFSSPDH